ncbi:MAG: GntR family transcriptional regulator [Halanaerobiaceae bacterium]
MALDELTKKEQIINFAQSDPFLKISDIAENVQTTPRYVRTILSEANISLMKLREKYARNMEKRLKGNKEFDLQAKVSLKSEYCYNNMVTGSIQVESYDDSEYTEIQKIKEDDELIRIYQVQYVDENPYCIHELITYMDKDINRERLEQLDSIYDLLGRKGINRLQFMNSIITVERPGKGTKEYFDDDDYLIASNRTVLLNKIPIGIERIYLKSELAKMEFPGEIVV